jgi:hypothetical protein
MATRVFVCADHGMAIVYFLQSDVLRTLQAAGIEVVLLTDDEIKDTIAERFGGSGLLVEGLRLSQAREFATAVWPRWQWALAFLRRVGGSWRINTEAMDSHIWEVWKENSWFFRLGVWFPCAFMILLLRSSSLARRMLIEVQNRFRPIPRIYADLFDKYNPSLVIASTPGWRLDRYILREAAERGVPGMSAIVGWDNPSSYAIPGATVDWATCWSEVQKRELVRGSDWPAERVHVGGMPSYDGYLRKSWVIERDQYFREHHLDPARRLISYASSFVHFAPNLPNIEALARLVSSDRLAEPAQLLVRLHPSHFQDRPRIFAEERIRIQALAAKYPHVHVVKPVPLGGSLGYYSGEDMDEKSSMMTHSDVMVTVYSTMLVETAIHDTPLVAAVIDTPGGWNVPNKYSLSLRKIGNWPTHRRFREARAGRVAASEDELREAMDMYLKDRSADAAERKAFVEQEIAFSDGTAGRRTGDFILRVLSSPQQV